MSSGFFGRRSSLAAFFLHGKSVSTSASSVHPITRSPSPTIGRSPPLFPSLVSSPVLILCSSLLCGVLVLPAKFESDFPHRARF